MDPFDEAIFAVGAPCLPCCRTPLDCQCAFLLPLFGTHYVDYAHAAAVLADPHQVVDCYGYFFNSFGGAITSLSVDVSVANQVTWDTVRASPSEFGQYINLALKAGDTLTLNYSGTMFSPASPLDVPSVSFVVYDCAGTQVHSDVILDTASGSFTWTVTADSVYYVLIFYGACVGTPMCGWSTATSVLSAAHLVANPVVANWDDSGTTRQLEACPKLYLPLFTESSGDWYASCSDAATVLASAQVSNCVGFGPPTGGFTATDGGTTLTLAVPTYDPSPGDPSMFGSVNVLAGQSIACAYSWAVSGGGSAGPSNRYQVLMRIYDDTGTFLGIQGSGNLSGTSGSGTLTFTPAPYSGRYLVEIDMTQTAQQGALATNWNLSGVISSSSTLSVNPVQALYDTGLDCPSRLDCGDSCP